MSDIIINQCEERMKKAIERLNSELDKLRTGRANPAVLDGLSADYYGTATPLNQIAVISVSEARQLLIKPFDKNSLKDIEVAINEANLNLVPNNDGENIRINFPAITEETRKSLVKDVKKIGENIKVEIRNSRKDANDELKKSDLREDEQKAFMEDVQELTNKYNKLIDEICSKKEKDLMTI
ncbi:MAG: ribosome recycling factor [Bacilli bacterium]